MPDVPPVAVEAASGRWRAGSGPPRPRRTNSRRIRSTRATIASRRTAWAVAAAAAPEVDPVERARGLAWRSLNKRDRTVDEVGGMLLGKRVEPGDRRPGGDGADRARLPRRRPLRRALRRGPAAPRRLGLGSHRPPPAGARGRRSESIEAAVAAQDPEEELDAARELLRRRCPTPPTTRAERDRALGILMRRGYAPELAFDALRRHCRRRAGPRLLTASAQVCADRPAVLRSGAATDQARGPENTSKQTLLARDQAASRDGRPNTDPETLVSRPFPTTKTELAAI